MTDAGKSGPEHILVVDDNEGNRDLARAALEDEGFRVTLASGGVAGVEAFARHGAACVLLDVRMPDQDGFVTCTRIRSLPSGADTPIVFLTAQRDIDTFDQALEAGADDFLAKPVRPAELVARVRTALKLRRLRVELREHYELLRHQRDALLRVQLQKERLSAFVVHDLKNPVSAMDLHAQLLLRDSSLSESARDSATQIRQEAHQLNRMILNLLDVSRGDEGKLAVKVTAFDARVLLAEVAGELAPAARVRTVRLDVASACDEFVADRELLRRVLVNLAENALRHAPRNTVVEVTAHSTASAQTIRIRDHGLGVPRALRDKIFDPFVRLEQEDEQAQSSRSGRGLGLAFCKLAVEAHGGVIHIEEASPGAIFEVTLPMAVLT
jgi:signal transduction histidine kinase